MGRRKALLGICLIVLAAGGLLFWEVQGREVILTDTVLVTAKTIEAGTVVSREDFKPAAVPKENLIAGALKPKDIRRVEGLAAGQNIAANSQINAGCFRKTGETLGKDESIFVLPEAWISMRSSSLRKGDWIDIYGAEDMTPLGRYQVAYVKDDAETEVKDADGRFRKDMLKREDGTSVISNVEVIADISRYEKIRKYCTEPYGTLLLIQRGGDMS